mmetsp:Transcript_60512/g.198066  ORF Transcript_60512/g.198066 Transcript_60512/m.198066 type:complete len:283 (+) Transcript_60512:458-1306(+)
MCNHGLGDGGALLVVFCDAGAGRRGHRASAGFPMVHAAAAVGRLRASAGAPQGLRRFRVACRCSASRDHSQDARSHREHAAQPHRPRDGSRGARVGGCRLSRAQPFGLRRRGLRATDLGRAPAPPAGGHRRDAGANAHFWFGWQALLLHRMACWMGAGSCIAHQRSHSHPLIHHILRAHAPATRRGGGIGRCSGRSVEGAVHAAAAGECCDFDGRLGGDRWQSPAAAGRLLPRLGHRAARHQRRRVCGHLGGRSEGGRGPDDELLQRQPGPEPCPLHPLQDA